MFPTGCIGPDLWVFWGRNHRARYIRAARQGAKGRGASLVPGHWGHQRVGHQQSQERDHQAHQRGTCATGQWLCLCVCVCVPMLICRCGTVEPLMTDHLPTTTFFSKTSSFQFLFLQATPLLLDFQNGQLSGVLLYVCQTFLPSFIIAFVLW